MDSEALPELTEPAVAFHSHENTDTFTNEIISNPILHEAILSRLSPLEIVLFSRTCRIALDVVQNHYIPAAFSINRILSRYFTEPLAFRAVQARTGTLISGSTALQFFTRTVYPNSDLDLYISTQHVFDLIQWLVERGYTFVPGANQAQTWQEAVKTAERRASAPQLHDPIPEEEDQWICLVLNLMKTSSNGASEETSQLKVQCTVVRDDPIRAILALHSSKFACHILLARQAHHWTPSMRHECHLV